MANIIRDSDLVAVRAVLNGSVDLVRVARSYTVRHSVVTAVAILHAVGRTSFGRGEYREALQMLALYPVVPSDELPEKYPRLLVDSARRLGLHSTEDHNITVLTEQPLLNGLIRQKGARKNAHELYKAARERREAQFDLETKPNRQHNLLMSALKNPSVASVLQVSPNATVEEIRSALEAASEILNAYFPKQR